MDRVIESMSIIGESFLELLTSTFHTIQSLTPPDPISQLAVIAAWCSGIIVGIIVTKLFLNKA